MVYKYGKRFRYAPSFNESILGLKKAKNLGKIGVSNGFQIWKTMVFKVSESTLGLKKAKNLGKYKIFLMTVY